MGKVPRPPRCTARSLALAGVVAGASLAVRAADSPANDVLLAPTQGRPAIVEPGGKLTVQARLGQPVQSVRIELVAGHPPVHRHRLDSPLLVPPTDTLTLELVVPRDVPEQTYDLELWTANRPLRARHAVAVRSAGERLRLVHLSSMNIGEPGTPAFDPTLPGEVNLWGPDLLILTGDLLDVLHPDPAAGWCELCDYLTRFEAPALIASGDHDDPVLWSRHLAPSPVGTLAIGDCLGVVLSDSAAQPITGDDGQLEWVRDLLTSRDDRLKFVVTHDDRPNLLYHWQESGELRDLIHDGRLGLWFAGGCEDWDGVEYRDVIDAAAPLLYLRSHMASRSCRDGATGVSHYRVVDIVGQRVLQYGERSEPHVYMSLPTGRLEVQFDGPNDGSQSRLVITAVNTHAQRVGELAARVLVANTGAGQPWCLGGRLHAVADLGRVWQARVRFDLPDRGAARIVVGTGPRPVQPTVNVLFEGARELRVRRIEAGEGEPGAAGPWSGVIRLENVGAEPAVVRPLLRLDGTPVAYRLLGADGPYVAAYRLRLAPGQGVALQPDLEVLRIRPGRRELQVYVEGGAALTPATWPLDVIEE